MYLYIVAYLNFFCIDITNPCISPNKAPLGFNLNPDRWSVKSTISGEQVLTTSVTLGVYYGGSRFPITLPIGEWNVYFRVPVGSHGLGGSFPATNVVLSGNTTGTEIILTDGNRSESEGYYIASSQGVISNSSKKTYYLLMVLVKGSASNLLYETMDGRTGIISATCSYL